MLPAQTIEGILTSDRVSIALIRKNNGEKEARRKLIDVLIRINDFMNVGGKMNDDQLMGVATELIKDFYWLSIEDFKLCLIKMVKGVYGPIYGRIDITVIYDALNQYTADRGEVAEQMSHNNHQTIKQDERKPLGVDKEGQYIYKMILESARQRADKKKRVRKPVRVQVYSYSRERLAQLKAEAEKDRFSDKYSGKK